MADIKSQVIWVEDSDRKKFIIHLMQVSGFPTQHLNFFVVFLDQRQELKCPLFHIHPLPSVRIPVEVQKVHFFPTLVNHQISKIPFIVLGCKFLTFLWLWIIGLNRFFSLLFLILFFQLFICCWNPQGHIRLSSRVLFKLGALWLSKNIWYLVLLRQRFFLGGYSAIFTGKLIFVSFYL